MIETTPTKNGESPTLLTPVWYSPSPQKTITNSSDSNVAACKARLETIVKTTLEQHQKWQLAEKRGLQLCTNIEAIKTKVIEQADTSTAMQEDFSLYPSSMKQHCDSLAIMVTICQDIALKTQESLRQLKALSKLPGSCYEVFHRSWQLAQYVSFHEELADRYTKEAQIKKVVSDNLPHCTTRSDLIRWSSLWEYPQYVDIYVQLLFAFFKEELDNKNAS